MMFRPGYNISSLPPQACSNTTSPLFKIDANYIQGWLALNLVNAGAVSQLAVSLDSHLMFVYAADGLFTAVQEAKVSSASFKARVSPKLFQGDPPGIEDLLYLCSPSQGRRRRFLLLSSSRRRLRREFELYCVDG